MKRLLTLTIIGALALPASASAGWGRHHPVRVDTPLVNCASMRLTATPVQPARHSEYCDGRLITPHVAVNGNPLTIIYLVERGWGAVYYGAGSVVFIHQTRHGVVSVLGATTRSRIHIHMWITQKTLR